MCDYCELYLFPKLRQTIVLWFMNSRLELLKAILSRIRRFLALLYFHLMIYWKEMNMVLRS